ncbi:hypothetical protein [Parabacteroides sp. PF5-6]|uniref:hypothetical protein n=1 Tax=Parabacteroides sp. PF5-6 TaxID=1742403 RepID=UPI002404E1BA|nr:hypothetical protein [Parabacteroides sp. PF5-6]MDF9830952.1 hypothetical protein [Parabacteroides sp. PF5-6]
MKQLTLVPIGGLANRMLAITSAIGFCRENQVRLKVVWFKDWGMGADFHSLFNLSPTIENVEVIDAKIWDYRFDRPRKRNLWIPYLWQKAAFDKRIYEKEIYAGFSSTDLQSVMNSYDSVYLVHFQLFYERPGMLNILQPQPLIQDRIRKQVLSLGNSRVIGLHIRRGDHSAPTLNSPLSLFIAKIEEELALDKNTKFYVASDSYEEKRRLKECFGDSILTSFDKVRRDTEEGIFDALVEMYTLSETEKVYGSLASTFSLVAAKISNVPFEVLSIES